MAEFRKLGDSKGIEVEQDAEIESKNVGEAGVDEMSTGRKPLPEGVHKFADNSYQDDVIYPLVHLNFRYMEDTEMVGLMEKGKSSGWWPTYERINQVWLHLVAEERGELKILDNTDKRIEVQAIRGWWALGKELVIAGQALPRDSEGGSLIERFQHHPFFYPGVLALTAAVCKPDREVDYIQTLVIGILSLLEVTRHATKMSSGFEAIPDSHKANLLELRKEHETGNLLGEALNVNEQSGGLDEKGWRKVKLHGEKHGWWDIFSRLNAVWLDMNERAGNNLDIYDNQSGRFEVHAIRGLYCMGGRILELAGSLPECCLIRRVYEITEGMSIFVRALAITAAGGKHNSSNTFMQRMGIGIFSLMQVTRKAMSLEPLKVMPLRRSRRI